MRWFAILSIVSMASAAAAVLGIDYGTEYVKSSLVAPNAPFEIVLTPDSQRKDASGLVIKPGDGDRIYGSSGVSLASKYPQSALYAVKPLLGVPFDDLRVGLFEETHPGLNLARTSRNSVGFNVSGTVIPVEEVVAMQLKDVKLRGTSMLREKTHSKTAVLRDIAVSVPGHFGSAQRQALIDAVTLTDANLVGLVSDGVAVAVNYANSPAVSAKLSTNKHYVVVYDAGAASTSSTLVSLKLRDDDDKVVDVEVEGFGNSLEMSGRSLTALLREMLVERFFESYKKVDRTPRFLNRLWREAERAKHVLSANTEVFVHVESLADDADLSTRITREQFEKAVGDMKSEVVRPLKDSLANFKGKEVDAVVLAGGATRTPFVLEELKSEVGESKLSKNVNADEANVQGTCMRGINLSGLYRSKRTFEVSDIVTNAYTAHIKTSQGGPPDVVELFSLGSPLGADKSLELPKDITQLEIYEGRKKLVSWELPYVKQNINALFEPGPFTCVSKAKLMARFSVDANGVFKLNGIDAVCDSVTSPSSTTSAPTGITNEVVSETEKEQATVDETQTDSSSTTSEHATTTDENTTQSSAEPSASDVRRPKTRRVTTQVSWAQAPIGATERGTLRAHLAALDKGDEDRKQYSILHHELESLTYRLRSLVDEGRHDLAEVSGRLLMWIEEGAGDLEELRKNLAEAQNLFKQNQDNDAATNSQQEEPTEPTSSTSTQDKSGEVHDEL